MALQFNGQVKGANAAKGLPYGLVNGGSSTLFGTGRRLNLYPTSVPYPSAPIEKSGDLPAGALNATASPSFSQFNNSVVFSLGTISYTATVGGTIGWWAVFDNTTATVNNVLISDSVGLIGSNKVLTVSNLSPTAGQIITIQFSLVFN